MTPRRPDQPEPPDREPVLSEADSAAFGRRIHEVAQTVDAPATLRARLARAQTTGQASWRPGVLLRARTALAGHRRGPLAALGATGLAAVLAAVLVFGGGGAGAPSVDEAAALALAPANGAAPAVSGRDDLKLGARVDDVAFPNYAYRWPAWHAAGARQDTISGRDATTVVYRGPAGDVGYTIVAGDALPEPTGGRRVQAGGQTLRVLQRDGATVVTWRRGGHTCILAARGRGVEQQLVKFATWA
jgi:hypothetical protein